MTILEALPSALFCQKFFNIVCLNNCSHLLNLMIISLALRKRLAAHMQFILHVDRWVSMGYTANLCAIDLTKAFDKVNHFAFYIKLYEELCIGPDIGNS